VLLYVILIVLDRNNMLGIPRLETLTSMSRSSCTANQISRSKSTRTDCKQGDYKSQDVRVK
jgi:hypothetical protein